MVPYYPARDGYPSMLEPEDTPSATEATRSHRSFVDRLFEDRFPVPGRTRPGRSRASSRRSFEKYLLGMPTRSRD